MSKADVMRIEHRLLSVIDGNYYDSKLYEITSENYFKTTHCKNNI